MKIEDAISKVRENENLNAEETHGLFDAIFEGQIDEVKLGDFLIALRSKGEALPEIQGAVASMRSKMIAIKAPEGAVDIVGTGGDGHGTFNVSTAAAIVVAACGVPVAKHGNKASSSLSGSSDVLAQLGVNLDPGIPVIEKALNEIGLAFLFAPTFHPSMRHVADIRKKLGVRTIFNLLGPLTNPANVKRHMIGVYAKTWILPMAGVLKALGSERAWLAFGHDGLDEISTTGPTSIVTLTDGHIRERIISPEEAGLPLAKLEDLKGGDAAANAGAVRDLLNGTKSAYRDIVLMNAAAALIVAGKAQELKDGVAVAAQAIDSGAANAKLNDLVKITNNS